MQEIIQKILEKIEKKDNDELLSDISEGPNIKFDGKNFFDFSAKKSEKKIAFVDGGNLEILKTPSISLFFNRIYYTIYQNNKRIENKKFEFYSLIYSSDKNNKLVYKTEYFFTVGKFEFKEYEFDSFDKKITFGNRRAKISLIGNIIRRFAELKIASSIDADFVVLDGSLEATYPFEEELIKNAMLNSVLCGISKTTELLTKYGNSVTAYLLNMTNKKEWYYYCTKAKDYKTYFAKLHPKSKYVFRIDIAKETVDELFGLLKENSKDAVFIGYPYGLVEADRFARVSQREKDMLKIQLEARAKKNFEKLLPYIKSIDAHDVLDNIG
ncbi:MAG: DNA double-strand break repair nuclease NurA [Nanoarchaeota archaeon]